MTVSCGDQYSGALTVARLNMANRYSSGEKHLSDVKNMLTMLGNPDSDTDVQGIATDLIEAHKRIETIKRNLDNTRNDLDSKPSSADVNALRVSVDAAQGRLGLLNTKVARVETDVADNMVINEASADNMNVRIRNFGEELTALQEIVEDDQTHVDTIVETLNRTGELLNTALDNADGLRTDIGALQNEVAEYMGINEDLDHSIGNLRDETRDVNFTILTLRDELAALQERAFALEGTLGERGQEYTAFVVRTEEWLNAVREDTDGLQNAIDGHTRELADLRHGVANNADGLTGQINECRSTSADLRSEAEENMGANERYMGVVEHRILAELRTLRERAIALEGTLGERGPEYTAFVDRTNESLNAVREGTVGLRTDIDAGRRELAALQDEVADNVNGRIRTFRELDEVADNMAINEASADNMRQDLDHSIDNLRDETRNVKFAILTLREALTVLQEIVENDQTRVDTLELTLNERESVLQRQIDECQSTLTDLKSEADGVMSAVSRKIEELNDTGINLSSQSTAFTHLMQHADTRFTTALNAFETNAEAELSVQKERFDTQLQDFKYQMTEALNAAATQLAARKWEEQIQEVKNSVDELKNRPPQPVTEAPVTPGTNLDLEIPKTSVQYNSFFEYIQGLEDR
eukprot:gene12922-15273_t